MNSHLGYIIIAYLSLFCYGIVDNIRGPAYPEILSSFNLSLTKGSLIFALSSLSNLPIVMLGRKWLYLFGELNAQRIFLLLIAVGCFGIGYSGYLENGYSILLLSSVVMGLGFGGTTISTNVLVANGSSPKNSRRLFSGLHSMYGISSIFAPLLFSIAVFAGLDWRHLFISLAALPIISIVLTAKTSEISHGRIDSKKPSDVSFIKRLIIGFLLSFYVASEVAISSRLVLFITNTKNINPADASIYLSVFFILLFLGRLLFSIFQLPFSNYRLMVVSCILSIILLIGGIFINPIFLPVSALTMSYYYPCAMDWLTKRFGVSRGYMLTSVMTSVAVVLVIMHCSFGIISDKFGVVVGMTVAPIAMLITLICLVLSRKEFKIVQ